MANSNDPTSPLPGAAEDNAQPTDDSRLKRAAADVADRAKSAAQKVVEHGKQRVERSAFSASSALRRAADECEGENAWFGSALRKSADGIETAARSIAEGDITMVVDQVNDFARRQPALFLGASLALGFAAARLGKTALDRGRDEEPDAYGAAYGDDFEAPETGA